jgi:tetratricopeptide (TPR) repeat protein
VTTLLLVTQDAKLAAAFRPHLPPTCTLEERGSLEEALSLFEVTKPDMIVTDLDTADLDCRAFFGACERRLQSVPLMYILFSEGHSAKGVEQARALPVRQVFKKPIDTDEVLQMLKPLKRMASLRPMTLIEHLAGGFVDTDGRQLALKAPGIELSLVFSAGYLWGVLYPLFYHQYSVALSQAGYKFPEQAPSSPVELAAMEEALRPPSPELMAVKRQTVLSAFAGLPFDQAFEARWVDEPIPEGLIPLEIPSLVVSLVEHVPDSFLGLLKRPKLKVRAPGGIIPEDLPITPHQGYLLAQCSESRRVSDLLQTAIMPERQALTGLYVLLLLGLLVSEPRIAMPFSLSELSAELDREEVTIRRQAEAIQNLVQSLEMPGGSPYQILGIPQSAGPQEARLAFEAILGRLAPEKLHAQVVQDHQKDLLFIRAKLSESLLILQSSFLDTKREQSKGPSVVLPVGGGSQAKSESNRLEAQRLVARTQQLLEDDQPFEALQYVNLALFLDPSLSLGHNLLAKILERKGDQKSLYQAQNEYLSAVEHAPKNAEFLMDAAEFFLHQGLSARCRSFLDRAWDLDPRNGRLQKLYGVMKTKKG